MEKNPGRPFLSACLMVKDEEQNIGRCLNSIKDIVDEIIVVDTGSKDRTMEIARSFGAIIFEHPWESNFSVHRNQSIDHATGEWVFIIDADEEVKLLVPVEKAKEYLREFLNLIELPSCCGGIILNDIQCGRVVMRFNTTRFFRRDQVRYKGIVHNVPDIPEGSQAVLCEFLSLNHYGYDLSPEKKEQKFKRTNSLLKKRLEQDPKDYLAMFYLCQQNAEGGRNHEQAIHYGEKYIQARDEIIATGALNFNQSIYFTLFRTYLYLNRPEDAKRILQMGLEDIKDGDLDLSLAVLEYGVYTKDAEVIFEGAKSFREQFNRFTANPALKANRFVYSHSPEGLSYVLFQEALTYLELGYKCFGQLLTVLKDVSAPLRQGFLNDFQKELNKLGMSVHTGDPSPVNGGEEETKNYVQAEIN